MVSKDALVDRMVEDLRSNLANTELSQLPSFCATQALHPTRDKDK